MGDNDDRHYSRREHNLYRKMRNEQKLEELRSGQGREYTRDEVSYKLTPAERELAHKEARDSVFQKSLREAVEAGENRGKMPGLLRIALDRAFSSFNMRLGRQGFRAHHGTSFEAEWAVDFTGRDIRITMTRFDVDTQTAKWAEHAKHDYIVPADVLMDTLNKAGAEEVQVTTSSILYNIQSTLELVKSRADAQKEALENISAHLAKTEAEEARNRRFRGPQPSGIIMDEAKLSVSNISEDGDDAAPNRKVQNVNTPTRIDSPRTKRVVKKAPTREPKTHKLACPTHKAALVYNGERGVWKCPEKGCRIIHRPPIDTDQVALGKPPVDLRIVVPDASSDPSLFLMASNNVCVDITDIVGNLQVPNDVIQAVDAAKRAGAPNYVNRDTVTFTITVPRTVVIGYDKTPD